MYDSINNNNGSRVFMPLILLPIDKASAIASSDNFRNEKKKKKSILHEGNGLYSWTVGTSLFEKKKGERKIIIIYAIMDIQTIFLLQVQFIRWNANNGARLKSYAYDKYLAFIVFCQPRVSLKFYFHAI